ncbi:hypothetical protein [Marinomonas sp. 2405UD68-3]|uniref:hypothetical protein n=1 Tax=Marinomonas sp. 2405UD68-3 TaxID=3391835 RepID=UPI0039C9CAE0
MNHIRKTLSAIIIASSLMGSTSALSDEETHFNATKTTQSHLVKAQFYRWYQLYERPMNKTRIENQMDILAKGIMITSAAGQVKGKENYHERVKVFTGWKNAHHVQAVNVIETSPTEYQLTASIQYQNIKPDGEKSSYSIDYDTRLIASNSLLPTFAEINIKPTGTTMLDFEDAYPENRMLSLVHYWAALMEQLDGNVEPFKELLTPNFTLNFSSVNNKINSIDALSKWLNGAPLQLKQSSHHLENFSVVETEENHFTVNVDFDWYGITKTDQKMVAKTRHTWAVIDNPDERFARVQNIHVETLEAFRLLK